MSDAKWYVVHTYSGYENKVKANIDKTIENRHLEDQILEVRVPMQEVVELKNGVQKASQKKMFPGYVLIHMIMNDDTWYVVRNTRGVTGFVGPGSKPVPLEEEEMANLGIKQEDIVTYKPRVMRNSGNVVVNGSVAVLIPKEKMALSERQMEYFSSAEYRKFYQIARNYQTRSLNVDATSVFFYGVLKECCNG